MVFRLVFFMSREKAVAFTGLRGSRLESRFFDHRGNSSRQCRGPYYIVNWRLVRSGHLLQTVIVLRWFLPCNDWAVHRLEERQTLRQQQREIPRSRLCRLPYPSRRREFDEGKVSRIASPEREPLRRQHALADPSCSEWWVLFTVRVPFEGENTGQRNQIH